MFNTFRVFYLIIGVLGLLAGCVTPIDYGKCQRYSSEAVRYQCERDENRRFTEEQDTRSKNIDRMFGGTDGSNARICTSQKDYFGNVTTKCRDN